jgi:glycosyltransferase involved in cell wall biosynthesis
VTEQRDIRVLAVGMLPPPYGGQALMFLWTVERLKKKHFVEVLDTQAQKNIGTSGRFSFFKVGILIKLIYKSATIAFSRRKFDILYYCPSGPSRIGQLKDLTILTLLRWKARKTVYHFHGTGGISYLLRMPAPIIWWARRIMFAPDLSIRCADVLPNDAVQCNSKNAIIICNGIPDPLDEAIEMAMPDANRLRFCYVGVLTEEKGVYDLVEIARRLRDFYTDFLIDIVGEGTNDEVSRLDALIRKYALDENLKRRGVLLDKDKFNLLAKSSLFLFPTFFRSETQPLAVIEAMALGIPAVVSDWRGLKSIVDDGVNGGLVPPRDPAAFATKIVEIMKCDDLAKMKRAARQRYLRDFTLEAFLNKIEGALADTANGKG